MIDLKTILKQNPSCLNSRATFKSVLLDKYPSEKRMVNILTILFECGIASKIKAKKIISPNDMQSLLTQVENEYGLPAKYTQDAILIWAAAFGADPAPVENTPPFSSHKPASHPVDITVPSYTTGNANDYEVVKKHDGYYISSFKGIEQLAMTIPSIIDGKYITGIGQNAFQCLNRVKTVTVSEGIEIIEDGAFQKCSSLKDVSLPNTLQRIGSSNARFNGAFAYTNIQTIVIPQTVNYIGPYTFYNCPNLQKVKLPRKLTDVSN